MKRYTSKLIRIVLITMAMVNLLCAGVCLFIKTGITEHSLFEMQQYNNVERYEKRVAEITQELGQCKEGTFQYDKLVSELKFSKEILATERESVEKTENEKNEIRQKTENMTKDYIAAAVVYAVGTLIVCVIPKKKIEEPSDIKKAVPNDVKMVVSNDINMITPSDIKTVTPGAAKITEPRNTSTDWSKYTESLSKLKELYNQGLITEQEYVEKKTAIVEKL